MKKIFFLIIMIISLFSCKGKKNTSSTQTKNTTDTAIPKVSIFRYNERYLNDYILLNGNINPVSEIKIMPNIAGKVSNLLYQTGSYLRKNTVIAFIDPSKPGMAYRLNPIKAPISGTITAINVSIGDTVSPNTPIIKMAKISNLEVVSNISEKFIGKIHIGLKANMTLEAFPNEVFKVKVKHIDPILDPITRTLKIKFEIESKTNKIKAGMFADIKIIYKNVNPFLIPKEALIFKFKKTYIFVVGLSGISEKEIEVKESEKYVNSVVLLSGLKTGDKIIVSDSSVVNPKRNLIIDKEFSYIELMKYQMQNDKRK